MLPAIYPGNVIGGSPLYVGLSLADVIYYTTVGADTFEKGDFPGLRAVLAEVQGGGGQGGGADTCAAGENSVGGGGAGGGYARRLILVTDLDEVEEVVVGDGGNSAAPGAAGEDGEASSFDTLSGPVVGNGGAGGTVRAGASTSGGINPTTAGATGTGGDVHFRGEDTGTAQALFGGVNQFWTGKGGDSYFGRGKQGRVSSGNGLNVPSDSYGAGGSGAGNGSGQAVLRTGGTGAQGIVIAWLLY